MCSKAPFHFEPGLEQFEDSTSRVLSRRRVQFWFDGGDWGICRYIRNDTEIQRCTFFFSRSLSVAALRCPIVSRWQCASTPHNPVYLHPLQSSGEQEPEGRLERVQRHTRETMSGRYLHCSRRKEQNQKKHGFCNLGCFSACTLWETETKKNIDLVVLHFSVQFWVRFVDRNLLVLHYTHSGCVCVRVFCASLLIYVSLLSILPLLFGVIVIICSCLLGL